MIAFEVLVNGEKKCVAGVAKGVLSVIIDGAPLPRLAVVGKSGENHLRWITPRLEPLELKAGDEVTVRVVETNVVDDPVSHRASPTRAERESKIKNYLEKARALLPESVDFQTYKERLSQNHLMGAMDVLEQLGDESGANAEFWQELGEAAHAQTAYEDGRRYRKKQFSTEEDSNSNPE